MSNVVELNCITKLDLDPDRMLENTKGLLTEVVILGYDKDGNEYFAASKADGASVLWHLERAKKKLLEMPEDFE